MALKPGDVVRLKSGGPHMTVSKLVNEYVHCQWFSGARQEKMESASFASESLEVIPEDER